MGLMDSLFGRSNDGGGIGSTALPPAVVGPPTVSNPAAPSPAPPPTTGATNTGAPPAPDPAPVQSSPLDSFTQLWETPKDDKGQPLQIVDHLATPVFNIDPNKVAETAKTLDFTKDLTPELVNGIVDANGRLDTASLLKLINTVTQNAFVAGTLNTGNMVTQGLLKNNQNLKSALPASINRAALDNLDMGDNPILQHEAVQPLVRALRTMQMGKNPNANPADIAKAVNDYILGLSDAIVSNDPKKIVANKEAAKNATDFFDYLQVR